MYSEFKLCGLGLRMLLPLEFGDEGFVDPKV